MNTDLSLDNYKVLSAKHYYRAKFLTVEFERDLSLVLSIRKLLTRAKNKDKHNVRSILNKIITMCNVFGPEFTVRLIFLLIPNEQFFYIIPFLKYLNILPDVVKGINGKDIDTREFEMSNSIIDELEKL